MISFSNCVVLLSCFLTVSFAVDMEKDCPSTKSISPFHLVKRDPNVTPLNEGFHLPVTNMTVVDGNKEFAVPLLPAAAGLVAACSATLVAAAACVGIVAGVISAITAISGAFSNVRNDDAWVTITASDRPAAGGDALEITWFGVHDTDRDSLGTIGRGEQKTYREDLGGSLLKTVELRIDETDDICVSNFAFTVGSECSSTNAKELIDLPPWVISYITKVPLTPDCIWFGDSEGALGNFKFLWQKALACYKKYISSTKEEYARCMTYAMKSYDKREGGRWIRYTYNN